MIPNILIKIKKSLKEAYEIFIDNLNLKSYKCPNCKAKGKMKYHAEYDRKVIMLIDDHVVYENLSIVRLKCYSCGRTHALLPYFLIPYCTHGYNLILECLKDYFNGKSLYYIYNKYGVTHQLLYSWIKRFKKHQVICSLIFKEGNQTIKQLIQLIFQAPDINAFLNTFFDEHKFCFMQIKKSPG